MLRGREHGHRRGRHGRRGERSPFLAAEVVERRPQGRRPHEPERGRHLDPRAQARVVASDRQTRDPEGLAVDEAGRVTGAERVARAPRRLEHASVDLAERIADAVARPEVGGHFAARPRQLLVQLVVVEGRQASVRPRVAPDLPSPLGQPAERIPRERRGRVGVQLAVGTQPLHRATGGNRVGRREHRRDPA